MYWFLDFSSLVVVNKSMIRQDILDKPPSSGTHMQLFNHRDGQEKRSFFFKGFGIKGLVIPSMPFLFLLIVGIFKN